MIDFFKTLLGNYESLNDFLWQILLVSFFFFLINLVLNNLIFDIACLIIYSGTISAVLLYFKSPENPPPVEDVLKTYPNVFITLFILYLLYYFYFRKLVETSNNISESDFEGREGTVITPIVPFKYGEIGVRINSQLVPCTAILLNNEDAEIPKGAKVTVVKFENNIASVKRISDEKGEM